MARAKTKVKRAVRQDPKTHRVVVYFTAEEKKMLDHFLKRYRHNGCSTYIRKLVMTEVLGTLNRNYPTLFDQVSNSHVAESSITEVEEESQEAPALSSFPDQPMLL